MAERLHANPLKDASTGSAGVIAGELAAEEQSLLQHERPGYGAASGAADVANHSDDDSGYAMPHSQVLVVVGSLFLALYLAALDGTVVTTLLTQIASDLNAVGRISWIATAYLLSCAAFQPLFGKLSDIFGRKSLLIFCLVSFGLGCLICVTDLLWRLILGRFITGIGGGGLTSLGTITMSDIVPLRLRGLYQGLANVFFGLGAASGGVLGGVVADKLGWKSVFLLQVPLAALVGLALWLFLNLPAGLPGLGSHGSDMRSKLQRVDFLGSSLLVSALMGIMAAASFGGKDIAYSLVLFVALCVALAALLAAFVYVELYVSPEPVIPVELMAERTILASSLTNWFYTMAVFTYLFYVPIYYTSVMGLSATQNGLRLVPNFFGVLLGLVGAGLYMKSTGRYYNLAVVSGAASLIGVFFIVRINPKLLLFSQYTLTILPGLGYLSILTITLLSLIAAVPMKYQACTTSIQYTFRATGSTLGVSIASAIFQNVLASHLGTRVHAIMGHSTAAEAVIRRALKDARYVQVAPKIVQLAIRDSYSDGCKGALAFSMATVFLGVVALLFMREHKLHTSMNRE